jgi:hypothetical protein
MADKHSALVAVRAAFGDNVHPGAAYLVGSRDGCEPEEAVAAFREETSWQQVDVEVLDAGSDALSFFSEAGFRFFLPAYLVADIEGALLVADPVFHLTQSFCVASVTLEAGGETFVKALGRDALINPLRYGAMTFEDYARQRLSVFAREEAAAIVVYLEFKLDTDEFQRDAIAAALDTFWRERATSAPRKAELAAHVAAEDRYLRRIMEDPDG